MSQADLNDFFLIVNACIIFFMQCGFAFLECGAVRSKNATNILLKNMLDSFLGLVIYWIVGYAFAFGTQGNFFLGYDHFVLWNLDSSMYAHFFFHFVFAATASTIVSGAVAERCELVAYFVYSLVITGLVYPIVAHWAWDSKGWLFVGYLTHNGTTATFQDFAGSGVVHLTGGMSAFVGAAMLGPRLGRFDTDGLPRNIKGHSVPLSALGGFILFFGFFAFNGGSQAAIGDGDGAVVALAVVNTMVSGSFGGLTTMVACRISNYVHHDKPTWSLLNTINGGLAGMVSICAGCNAMHPWGAAITGALAGLVYMAVSTMVLKARVDDPIEAVAVHGGGGIWGLIAIALFNKDTGVVMAQDTMSALILAWNVLGAAAIIVWAGVISTVMFGLLRLCKMLRVSADIERKGRQDPCFNGMDEVKHGETAYPIQSYGDGWDKGLYNDQDLVPDAPDGPGFRHQHPVTAPQEKDNDSTRL